MSKQTNNNEENTRFPLASKGTGHTHPNYIPEVLLITKSHVFHNTNLQTREKLLLVLLPKPELGKERLLGSLVLRQRRPHRRALSPSPASPCMAPRDSLDTSRGTWLGARSICTPRLCTQDKAGGHMASRWFLLWLRKKTF